MRPIQRNAAPSHAPPMPPVSVVSRAAAILAAFDVDQPVLGVSELARRTALAKATVHRLAEELRTARVLDREEGRPGYRLGTWLFELGEMVPTHRSLAGAAQPIMEDLREATHERIHLAVLDGVDVVYVKILGGSDLDITSRAGGRLPAHATGVGKVLLAYAPTETVHDRIQA